VWILVGSSWAEVHLVDHLASRTSVQSNEIVVAVSVDTGSHAMYSLHVFSLLDRTSAASVRHDTTLAQLTVASVGGRTAHIQCGRTSLVLSISERLTVIELLARTHTSDHVLACFVLQSQINGVEVVHHSSLGDAGIQAVHGEGVVLWALRKAKAGCIDHCDVGAVTTSVAVALVALTPEVENVRESVTVNLASIKPGSVSFTTPSGLEKRVDGRSAAASRATAFGVVRHLVTSDAVSTLRVTTVLGPEASASKASLGDHVVGMLARLNAANCASLAGDESANTRAPCLHP